MAPPGARTRGCSQPAPMTQRAAHRSPSRVPRPGQHGTTTRSQSRSTPTTLDNQFSKSQLRRFRAMLISTGAIFPGGRRPPTPAGPPPSVATSPAPSPPLPAQSHPRSGWTPTRRPSSRSQPPAYTSPPPAPTAIFSPTRPASPGSGHLPAAQQPVNLSRGTTLTKRIGWWSKDEDPSSCL